LHAGDEIEHRRRIAHAAGDDVLADQDVAAAIGAYDTRRGLLQAEQPAAARRMRIDPPPSFA